MKKLYSLLALAFGLTTVASAQRLVNLQAEMTAPAANATITNGVQFNTNFIVRNVGTTTLKATDTVLYGYFIDGGQLSFSGGTPTTFFRTGKVLNQNDTMQINRAITITFPSSSNGARTYCVAINVMNNSVDSVKDNVIGNNDSCRSVTFAGGTVSVGSVSAVTNESSVTKVFPNPATSEVNFEVTIGGYHDVSIKVLDLTGRVVYEENKGNLTKGVHNLKVNADRFRSGLYLYQVVMGTDVSTGKFSVVK